MNTEPVEKLYKAAVVALEAAQAEISEMRVDHEAAIENYTAKCDAAQAENAAQKQTLLAANAVLAASKLALDQAVAQRDAALARLAELEKQEPVMVYDGRCIWDCGDGGHQDVTMLKMIAKGTKLFAAVGASPQTSQARELTTEQLRCLEEAHNIENEESYFSARPNLEVTPVLLSAFTAAHRMGWNAAINAKGES